MKIKIIDAPIKDELALFRELNKDEIYEEKGQEVNYALLAHGGTLYILFEPSDGSIDWRMNFSYWRKPYKDMDIKYRVHGGFLKCWKTVADEIIWAATARGEGGEYMWKKIVVAGYSHGGALAALCHEAIWFHRPDLRARGLTGYGFEAPRVYAGFRVKENLVGRWKHFFVYRNCNDIVTHLPLKIMGFADVGQMIKIHPEKKVNCISAHAPKWVQKALIRLVGGRDEE